MPSPSDSAFVISDEVRDALAEGRGVVALETTIVVHGLPAPINLEVAAQCAANVRASGAVPATVGVLDGRVVIGLNDQEVGQLADPERGAAKLSTRDLGVAVAARRDGATTVAATITLARRAGIDVMATGGLGGVHRGGGSNYDESADLTALSRTSIVVVASGVKSILDVGATLERLDSLGVAVLGYRTQQFPGFYRRDSGSVLEWWVEDERAAAASFLAHRNFATTGLLLANPVALEHELDRDLHDRALTGALEHAAALGVSGPAVTPVLLAEFARLSAGASVVTNRELVVANARLAGALAAALAPMRG